MNYCTLPLVISMLEEKIRIHPSPMFEDEYKELFSEPIRTRLLKLLKKRRRG